MQRATSRWSGGGSQSVLVFLRVASIGERGLGKILRGDAKSGKISECVDEMNQPKRDRWERSQDHHTHDVSDNERQRAAVGF